jgi:riboflavin kinase/FMN adenylyltransferase
MVIHKGYENLNLVNPVVTMGIFDGVHRGHCALLGRLVSRAREIKGESAVITFSPHPRLVLDKNIESLSFLTTMEEKMHLLENLHIDHLIIIEFSRSFGMIEACDFVKDILVGKIGTRHLILGYNHHFGRSREGDFNTIQQCALSFDFKVEQAQGFHTEEGDISSSSIRKALNECRLDAANSWLGYNYSLTGTIIEGRKIGRSMGFPTANIRPDYRYKLIPCDGVYAVEVILEGSKLPGMLSIGSNPTVSNDKEKKSIEVHILNFDKDIYGKSISVIFRKWLRNEIKFDSREQLTEQMRLDKQQAMIILEQTNLA